MIADDRKIGADKEYKLRLTPKGNQLAGILTPIFEKIDLSFKDKNENVPSWEMNTQAIEFNNAISDFIVENKKEGEFITSVFLKCTQLA
ncbi:MAG: hypothetical protein HC887_11850 [Desulfobacteraceae bacterium]|nr:hypothetical protein [Desulfobacteraceae bacterium]